MIKASVVGAASPLAGELIRVLINHPEVDLVCLFSPRYAGRWIGTRHMGLVGDTEMRFADRLDLRESDVVFVCREALADINSVDLPEKTRVILVEEIPDRMLPVSFRQREYLTGLSEVFRKPLVRGATAAAVAHPVVALTLISLYPLALHLMLNEGIILSCQAPYWIGRKKEKEAVLSDINDMLSRLQLSFTGINEANFAIGKDSRAVSVHISLNCSVALEEVRKIYESIYDDHNFTYLVDRAPDRAEVLGTQKCLIHLSKPDPDRLDIEAVADGVYRGGVGDAIHSMNLLFGLFEKIGLTFQAPMAFKESYDGC